VALKPHFYLESCWQVARPLSFLGWVSFYAA